MGRAPRVDIQNHYYHIINRANARLPLFKTRKDYQLFEEILTEAHEKYEVDIVAYCIMPNHFHLILCPRKDGEIQMFMQWLTLTHTQRVHAKEKTTGYGHIYQGRYKSFLVSSDEYLRALLRYVEQNPLRAGLVNDLKDWMWGSYYRRNFGTPKQQKILTNHMYQTEQDFDAFVNTPIHEDSLNTIRNSVNRGKPFGSREWIEKIIKKFGLESTVLKRGRPKKGT